MNELMSVGIHRA